MVAILLMSLWAASSAGPGTVPSEWIQETNRLVPPPPKLDAGTKLTNEQTFLWADYQGKERYPSRVVDQRGDGVHRSLRVDSLVPWVYSYEFCSCSSCEGPLEPQCDWKRENLVKHVKAWLQYPFEFGTFFYQAAIRPSPYPRQEGVENQSLTDTVFLRVERDSKGRVRKTINGYDHELDKEITYYLASQDSLGRDTAVTQRVVNLDTTGNVRVTKDWYRVHTRYDDKGRLATYWIETKLNKPVEDMSWEACLETQYLYDERGFNHVQIHRVPIDGRVVAVSSLQNNRAGRPVQQRVGYVQKGKVVDWLVGNFWQYDSLGRLTYRVQYTNPKWIGKSDAEGYFFRSNCHWWNRP